MLRRFQIGSASEPRLEKTILSLSLYKEQRNMRNYSSKAPCLTVVLQFMCRTQTHNYICRNEVVDNKSNSKNTFVLHDSRRSTARFSTTILPSHTNLYLVPSANPREPFQRSCSIIQKHREKKKKIKLNPITSK